MVSEFLCSTRVNDAADAASCRAAPWYSRHSDFLASLYIGMHIYFMREL